MTHATSLTFRGFSETLDAAEARRLARLRELQHVQDAKQVYFFGYGGKGRSLAQHIAMHSRAKVIVFDSSPAARERAAREGFATIDHLETADNRYGLILGACQAQAVQAAMVGDNRVFFQEAAHLFDGPHHANRVRDFSRWISENKKQLFETYTVVNDLSKQCFLDVLSFRTSLDPRDLAASKSDTRDMWFDVLERHGRAEYPTLLDVGAYDGDTLLAARRRLSTTRGIAVEANTALFDAIERIGNDYERGIQIVPNAAWSHKCRLRFSEVGGGMISVTEDPDGQLAAEPIDDQVKEKVDLIKMDIEGSELHALMGCTRTLRGQPDLAIAAYHRPEDLVQLSEFLIGSGYDNKVFDLHVAHYSDCLDDTIFYFLRKRQAANRLPEFLSNRVRSE